MADILSPFLEEIFDKPLSNAKINSFIDKEKNNLKMSEVFRDTELLNHLTFRHMWKSVLGVPPSKNLAFSFSSACLVGRADDDFIPRFVRFLREKVVIYRFINLDIEILNKTKKNFVAEMSDVQKVKEEILDKFKFRFNCFHLRMDATESLFTSFKTCIFDKHALQILGLLASSKGKSNTMQRAPKEITSLKDYFAFHEQVISAFRVKERNIFSSFVLAEPVKNAMERLTFYDVLSESVCSDSLFLRNILGSQSIYWESGKAMLHNRLLFLMESMNNLDSKPIVVFKSIKDMAWEVEPSFHFNTYYVPHHCLMNYVPKVTKTFVLISDNLLPPCTTISSKVDTSLYYCLLGDIPEELIFIPTHFNRYITNSMENRDRISKLLTSHKVYVISDVDIAEGNMETNMIKNKYYVEHQWNAHLTLQCPYTVQEGNNRCNVLLYDQFLMRYHDENKAKFETIKINPASKNAVVLVDNRENIFSVICLYITLANLQQNNWKVVVVCNTDNEAFFRTHVKVPGVQFNTSFKVPSKKFDIDIYNNLLKSTAFWESLGASNALFVQDDCALFKPGMEDMFARYDYIGAPWQRDWKGEDPNKHIFEHVNTEMVGNGGLSYRNVKAMARICKKYAKKAKMLHYDGMQQMPEDVFFSKFGKLEELNMPSYQEAQRFAVEQVCNLAADPLGFHKPWPYHKLSTIVELFNSFLQKDKM